MTPRKHFTIHQKLSFVETLEERQKERNQSVLSFAEEINVDCSQLRRWRAQYSTLKQFVTNKVNRRVNLCAKTIHTGRKSCLKHVEEELLMFILENREQGMSVSIRMVVTKAGQLDTDFCRKTGCTNTKPCDTLFCCMELCIIRGHKNRG